MSKPRPRKSPAEVSAARSAVASKRWDKLTPQQRRKAVAPAVAASPVNKRRANPPVARGTLLGTMMKLPRIQPRPVGRPRRSVIDISRVHELVERGASVRQVRDMLRISHGSAQRAVRRVRDEIDAV